MKKLLFLSVTVVTLFQTKSFSQALFPFTTCPDVSVAVVRSGTIADINDPYYIYTVNTATGELALLPGGPLVSPSGEKLQVNGVGLNKVDGFLYGLTFDGTVNTARFIRFDKHYGVTSTPNLAPPSSFTGINGYINYTAGDCDRMDNYFYSAFTANPGAAPGSLVLDKLFLGRIPHISVLAPGTPTAEYYEIDHSDPSCSDFINSIFNDPANTGFKDFVFNSFTNTFFTYLTYKPAGSPTFTGQMAEIKPIPGSSPLKYKLICTPLMNSYTAEVQGTLIDKSGNFEVLFSDGTMWKLNSSGAPFNYNGNIAELNSSAAPANPIIGDLASCGGPVAGPLPVQLTSFEATQQNCKTTFSWTDQNEINFSHYELEESFDGSSFSFISNIPANNAYNNSAYSFSWGASAKQAYYRLKAVDKDGNYTYSKVVMVINSCNNNAEGFMVNPNPAHDIINLNWYGIKTNSVMDITIYNVVGKPLQKLSRSVPAGSSSFSFQINGLPPGMYFIKAVNNKNTTSFEARLVKK